jgi:uncharacterized protein YukE
MTGPIRYQFGELGDGHTNMMATANDVAAEKSAWLRNVNLTMENWQDAAGGRFGELNQIWDTAAERTTEFQTQLAGALQQCQQNGQNALQQCLTALE